MPTKRSILIFQMVRYFGVVAGFAIAAMMLWSWGGMIVDAARGTSSVGLLGTLLFGIFFPVPVVMLSGWLGWRLWARWNANTIRWMVGMLIVVCVVLLLDLIDAMTESTASRPGPSLVFGVSLVPLVIVAAIVFRRASHWAIERADLLEAHDLYGQPPGHQTRVTTFATILSLCIFSAWGAIISRLNVNHSVDRPMEWLVMVLPLVVALGAYRFTLWIMRPRSRPGVGTGGFEVLPPAGRDSPAEDFQPGSR